MSAAKHTPGPWEAWTDKPSSSGECEVRSEGGRLIAWAKGITDDGPNNRGLANENARLIAAAPELLAACEAAAPVIEELVRDAGPCDHAVNVCVCGIESVLEQVRAAIAKARGQ